MGSCGQSWGISSNIGMPWKIVHSQKELAHWAVDVLSTGHFVNGHRLLDDPHDMEIRGFGRIYIWDNPNENRSRNYILEAKNHPFSAETWCTSTK